MNLILLIKKATDRLLLDRFKSLVIHTEAIYNDEVWVQIKRQVKKCNIKTWYIMTPLNYTYFKACFDLKQSISQLSGIMKERYLWLLAHNQHLELHIHFNKFMDISYSQQEKLILNAKRWMVVNLGVEPRELVPGWWIYDQNTLKLCLKHRLKIPRRGEFIELHDYNLLENRPWLRKENQ